MRNIICLVAGARELSARAGGLLLEKRKSQDAALLNWLFLQYKLYIYAGMSRGNILCLYAVPSWIQKQSRRRGIHCERAGSMLLIDNDTGGLRRASSEKRSSKESIEKLLWEQL